MVNIQYDPRTKIVSRARKTCGEIYPGGVGQCLFDNLKIHGEKIAQIQTETGEKQTFSELLTESVRVALNLRKLGIGPGDIVSMCIRNNYRATAVFNATQFIGAISASTDPTISTKDNEHLMNLIKPKVVLFDSASTQMMVDVFKAIKHEPIMVAFEDDEGFIKYSSFTKPIEGEKGFKPVYIEEKDIKTTCVIFFSSGTTGLPKAMCLGHHYALFNSQLADDDNMEKMESIISYTSFYWVSKLIIYMLSIQDGMTQVLCEAFEGEQFWINQEKYELQTMFAAPFIMVMILESEPEKWSSKLRYIFVGGSAIAPQYLLKLREKFPNAFVLPGYGQTESGLSLGFRPATMHFADKLTSCGLPIEGFKLKVVDPDTEETLGYNQEGEIRIYNDCMFNGYYKQDSSGCFDKDGFFKTGDVGYYDEDFCFFITDRIKEMFKYQSWHVVPLKIEQILATHPAVTVATVIGIPHDEDDHHALGVVVKREGVEVTADELIKYVEENTDERHWLRGGVKFVDEMPLTPTGKVLRRELKEMILKGEL